MDVGQDRGPVLVYLSLVLKASLSFPVVYVTLYFVFAFLLCVLGVPLPRTCRISSPPICADALCRRPRPSSSPPSPLLLVARYASLRPPAAPPRCPSNIALRVPPPRSSPWCLGLASPESFVVCRILTLCRNPVFVLQRYFIVYCSSGAQYGLAGADLWLRTILHASIFHSESVWKSTRFGMAVMHNAE